DLVLQQLLLEGVPYGQLELLLPEWLGQVVGGPALDRVHHRLQPSHGGEHDYRQRGLRLADAVENLEAADAGQDEVEEHQPRRRSACSPESAQATSCPSDVRSVARNRRMLSSSSTTRMRPCVTPSVAEGGRSERPADGAMYPNCTPPSGGGTSLASRLLRMLVRVVLADDHVIVRQGLSLLLAGAGFDVVGEASDGHEVVRLARGLPPDVAVPDGIVP